MTLSNPRDFEVDADPPLRARGFFWAAVLPMVWMLWSWMIEVHMQISSTRWPGYGGGSTAWPLRIHYLSAEWLARGLFYSLYAVPVVLAVCLCHRRSRNVSVYLLCYGGAVSVAFGLALLLRLDVLDRMFD
jgi:hypothetical protein